MNKELQFINVDGENYGLCDKVARDNIERVDRTKQDIERVEWTNDTSLDNLTKAGQYLITGTIGTNASFPIINTGVVAANLTVLVTDDSKGNNVVTQVLNLNNNVGGEGNVYSRSKQGASWTDWGKLQRNVEVNAIGLGQSKTFDDLTDNGLYSGVNVYSVGVDNNGLPITSYETFILVVVNAYATGGGVTQLKYSLKLDGASTVLKRTYINEWSAWSEVATAFKLPIATSTELGGIISNAVNTHTAEQVSAGVVVGENGKASVVIPAATTEEAGVMTANDKVTLDSIPVEIERIKDGDTIVGQAREIHSKNGKTVTDSFLVRTTAGSGTIGDGVATLKSIGGNIVKNLANFSKINISSPNASLTYIDNVLKMTPVTQGSRFGFSTNVTNLVNTHKYYACCIAYLPLEDWVQFFPTGGNVLNLKKSGMCLISGIQQGSSANATVLRIGTVDNPPQNNVCYIFNLHVIDLTETFDEGKEPTVEECDRLFGTMGTLPQGLTIANPTEFKSTGFNQFNPANVIEGKTIVDDTIISGSNKLAVIPCLPCKVGVGENNGYCIHGEFGDNIKVYLTPLNPLTTEGGLYLQELTKDTTTNTYVPQIKGYMIVEVPTTANLCVHFLWSEDCDRDIYEPHYESKIELPQVNEYGLAGIQSSGTLACDEIDFVKGVYRKKIGAVDMGSLSWGQGKYQDVYVYYTTISDAQLTPSKSTGNVVTNKYVIHRRAQIDSTTLSNKGIMMFDNRLYLRDDAYTTIDTFKAAIQGEILYYELAEPIEYPLPKVDNNYISSDYGIEQFDSVVPCNANNLYYMRSLSGETRNYLDRMYGNTSLDSPTEVADYITNGIAENNKKAEDAVTLALRQLYIAAGAEYNDTNENVVKTAPWGENVTHKAGHYYLNGLGDITEEQMKAIYNFKNWEPLAKCRRGLQGANLPRTLFANSTQSQQLEFWSLYNAELAFYLNTYIEVLPYSTLGLSSQSTMSMATPGTSSFKSLSYFCGQCHSLRAIGTINTLYISSFGTGTTAMFYNCAKLEYANLYQVKAPLTLEWSPLFSKASMLYMIQNAIPTTAITITLHPDAYARLAEDMEIVAALEAQPLITLVSA